MTSQPITDIVADAVLLLPSYETDSVAWNGLLDSVIGGYQAIEDVTEDLINLRAISTSEGVQLDKLGTILDLPRTGGQSDADYATALLGRAGALGSSGTVNQLLDVYGLLITSTHIYATDYAPATIELDAVVVADALTAAEDTAILLAVRKTKAGGVGLILTAVVAPEFLWGDAAEVDVNGDLPASAHGFGDSADTDANGDIAAGDGGGNLARVLT